MTAEFGGSRGPRGYIMASFRADWVHPITDNAALIAGIGFGSVSYGFIYDESISEQPSGLGQAWCPRIPISEEAPGTTCGGNRCRRFA